MKYVRLLCLIVLVFLGCISCSKDKEQPIETNLTPEKLAGTLWVAEEYLLRDGASEFVQINTPYYMFFIDTKSWDRMTSWSTFSSYRIYGDIMYLSAVEYRIVQYSADKFELRRVEEKYINDKKADYRYKIVLTRKRGG